MKRLAFIPLLLLAFPAMPDDAALTPVGDITPIIRDLEQKMSSLESVYLEFTQERHLSLFAEPLKSSGVMLIARPDRIRWETTQPYGSILLGDSKSVAQFELVDGQWNKLKIGFREMLKQVMEQMVLMHQGRLDALTRDYEISIATGDVAVITLTPKDKDVRSMLSALDVIMEPDYSATREVVMKEPGGDFTRIVFDREIRNRPLPEDSFDLSKPLPIEEVTRAVSNE